MFKSFKEKPRPWIMSFIANRTITWNVWMLKTKLCCLCSLGSGSEINSNVEFTLSKVQLPNALTDVLKTRGLKKAQLKEFAQDNWWIEVILAAMSIYRDLVPQWLKLGLTSDCQLRWSCNPRLYLVRGAIAPRVVKVVALQFISPRKYRLCEDAI